MGITSPEVQAPSVTVLVFIINRFDHRHGFYRAFKKLRPQFSGAFEPLRLIGVIHFMKTFLINYNR
jgi:hypothetical protein